MADEIDSANQNDGRYGSSRLILGEEEKSVLHSQIASPSSWHSSVRFLLGCTSSMDGLILTLSAIAAIIAGAANPFAMVGQIHPSQEKKREKKKRKEAS